MPELDFVNRNAADVSLEKNIYIFDAPAVSTIYTYNLPPITCSGIMFKFIRVDRENSSTLNITTATDTINNSGAVVTTVSLAIESTLTLLSNENVWYTVRNNRQSTGSGTLLSGGFVANNGNPYQVFQGSVTNRIVSTITYPGSDVYTMSKIIFMIGSANAPFNFSVHFIRPDGTEVTTIPVFNAIVDYAQPFIIEAADIFNNLIPSGQTYLMMVINGSGGGNTRLHFYSFAVR